MAMKPKFARIAQGYENKIIFLKVLIDKGGVPEVKKRANVVAVPTFQMWKVPKPHTPEVVPGVEKRACVVAVSQR